MAVSLGNDSWGFLRCSVLADPLYHPSYQDMNGASDIVGRWLLAGLRDDAVLGGAAPPGDGGPGSAAFARGRRVAPPG